MNQAYQEIPAKLAGQSELGAALTESQLEHLQKHRARIVQRGAEVRELAEMKREAELRVLDKQRLELIGELEKMSVVVTQTSELDPLGTLRFELKNQFAQ